MDNISNCLNQNLESLPSVGYAYLKDSRICRIIQSLVPYPHAAMCEFRRRTAAGWLSLAKIFVFLLLLIAASSAQTPWDGAADTTWYTNNKSATEFTITTPQQLAGLARLVNGVSGASGNGTYNMSGKTITLGNDIALGGSADANHWIPIGYADLENGEFNVFAGTFDGKGHTVSGVYINTTTDYQGLFSFLDPDGTIENLGVVDSYIKGHINVGGLVGVNFGTISNSYSTSTVGGVAGEDDWGVTGGLVGNNSDGGIISNSYATGAVTGKDYVGGLVGYNEGGVSNSYSTGAVSNAYSSGGLIGGNGGTVSNSYYNKTTSKQTDTGKGTGKTTAEMKLEATYFGWDFEDTWRINSTKNDGYPYLFIKMIPTAANLVFTTTGSIYTGEPQGIGTVTGAEGMGAITVLYSGSTTVPTNAGTYAVTANIADGTDFTAATGIALGNYIIAKATAVTPTGLTAVSDQTLADVTLPAGWAWEAAATTAVGAAGTQTHKAKYTPADTANYNTLTGVDIAIAVTAASLTCGADEEEIDGECRPTPIISHRIAAGSIMAQVTGNAIVLSNLPSKQKVEVFGLDGKRVYVGNSANSKILRILIQTKGVYVVKAGGQSLRVVVK